MIACVTLERFVLDLHCHMQGSLGADMDVIWWSEITERLASSLARPDCRIWEFALAWNGQVGGIFADLVRIASPALSARI